MADHGGPTTRPTSGPTTYPTSGPTTPTTYPTSGGGTSGMSGPIVGHVGPDRWACRARSSGMSGPIVGHVGPDFGRVVSCQKLPFSASISLPDTCREHSKVSSSMSCSQRSQSSFRREGLGDSALYTSFLPRLSLKFI